MNARYGGSVTSISDADLRRLASEMGRKFSAVFIAARVVGGRRWAALSGAVEDDLPLEPPRRIRLREDAGFVLYKTGTWTAEQEHLVLRVLRERGYPDACFEPP